MGNLLSRLRGKGEPEIARGLTLDQYIQKVIASGQVGYVPPTTYYTISGRPAEPVAQSFQDYAQDIYAAHPIIFGLMEARRSVFSEARFCWRAVKNGNPGDVLPINDGLELLENPWPGATTGTLLDRMRQDSDLGGTAFVVRQTGSDGEERLRRLRPDWVQIVLSGDPWKDPFVDFLGITYAPNGPNNSPVEPFLADEVAIFAPIPDPLAQFRGMSWLSPVLREIEADKSATTHRDSTLRQGGWLGPIVRPPQGTTLDQFKKFVEAADARHAGPNNAGKMVFLAPGSEITTVAQSLRDLDIKAVTGAVETRLTVAARVPAVIAGISEGLQGSSLNAGNYNAAKRAWIDTGLRPDWRKVCEALSAITPPPDLSKLDLEPGTEAQLWILESDIALLHEDRLDAAQVRSANATTINTLVTAGFKPDTIVTAVRDDDLSALEHTGLTSVQLTPPGTTPGQPGQPAPDQQDTQGEAAYQQALDELRASRAALLDAAESIARATGPWNRHPYPGQRYRHGYIPVSPVALLSPDMLDGEFGRELDSVDWLDHRLVAREYGVTVESPEGSDVAVHSVLSPQQAEDVADAIEQGQPYVRDRVEVAHGPDGVSVRFGGIDEDLDHEQAAELSQSLRDLGYVVEDAENPPDEPNVPEPPGDETPIPDEAARSVAAALASLRSEVDEIRRG